MGQHSDSNGDSEGAHDIALSLLPSLEPGSTATNFSRLALPRRVGPLALDVMAGQSTDEPRVHTLVILSSDGAPLVTEQFTSLVEFYRGSSGLRVAWVAREIAP